MAVSAQHILVRPRELKSTLRLVIEKQCLPGQWRMATCAPRFTPLNKLSNMCILVTRLAVGGNPLIFDSLCPRSDLFFVTTGAANGEMLSDQLILG